MSDSLNAEKLNAEIAKLIAETSKINTENEWYGRIAIGTMVGASIASVATLVGVFYKILTT